MCSPHLQYLLGKHMPFVTDIIFTLRYEISNQKKANGLTKIPNFFAWHYTCFPSLNLVTKINLWHLTKQITYLACLLDLRGYVNGNCLKSKFYSLIHHLCKDCLSSWRTLDYWSIGHLALWLNCLCFHIGEFGWHTA